MKVTLNDQEIKEAINAYARTKLGIQSSSYTLGPIMNSFGTKVSEMTVEIELKHPSAAAFGSNLVYPEGVRGTLNVLTNEISS